MLSLLLLFLFVLIYVHGKFVNVENLKSYRRSRVGSSFFLNPGMRLWWLVLFTEPLFCPQMKRS